MKNNVSRVASQIAESEERVVKVSIAASEQEKLHVYRLRYQVYVEEMGRRLPSADHTNRAVYDDFDDWAIIVYAQSGSKIIGSARLNIGTAEKFSPELVRMFHMDIFQNGLRERRSKQEMGFSSKYIVNPAYRRSQAAYLPIGRSYEIYRAERIQFTFAGSNPYMIPLYERMGFRRFADNFDIPEYGCMVPMVLVLEDAGHLRAVGSPFYRYARKCINDPAAADWFIRKFPAAARFTNSSLTSEDDLWRILEKKLGRSLLETMPVLKGLTEEEAKKFVHIGVLHLYNEGERVLTPGDFCHEINILLTGILEVSSPAVHHPLDTTRVKPGDLCGRVALLESGEQTVQAVAVTEVELLIISGMAFEAFSRSQPVIAHKIIRNIGYRPDMFEEIWPPVAR